LSKTLSFKIDINQQLEHSKKETQEFLKIEEGQRRMQEDRDIQDFLEVEKQVDLQYANARKAKDPSQFTVLQSYISQNLAEAQRP